MSLTLVLLSVLLVLATSDKSNSNLRKDNQGVSKRRKNNKRTQNNRRDLLIKATPVITGEIGGEEFKCDNILDKRVNLRNPALVGSHNKTKIGNVTFSEGFRGLIRETPKGILGLEDNLSGSPTSPLRLQRNFNHRENIYITKECTKKSIVRKDAPKNVCTLNVMGRGPAGFKGFGAMALMFKDGQSRVQLKFWSDGTAEAAVMFYDKDAKHLGTLYVDLRLTSEYIFERPRSVSDIKGIAVWPRGEQMEWHKFGMIGLCHE